MTSKSTLVVVAGLAFAASASAAIWTEVPDAGNLPGSAQTPTGSGALTSINGSTGGGDFEDMYQIFIDNPGGFTASLAGSSFDTQLWLFDANGIGVLGNDDMFGLQSGFSFPDDEGGATPAPGVFFIAISGFNDDPSSAGGAIFNQQNFQQVSGPDGPGGGSPVTNWTGGGAQGSYTLALTGASFVPTPGAIGLFGIAGLAATRRRRA